MMAYLDSSVVLRVVLGQPDRLEELDDITSAVTSGLTEVECLRTLDRLRLRSGGVGEQLPVLRDAVYRLLDETTVMEVTRSVLRRAGQSFPASLGTLDAVHLASALLWAEHTGEEPVMATHDRQLALAARATGLSVVGV